MHNRLEIIRDPPAPSGSSLFVYYTGTSQEVPIFLDLNCSKRKTQPIRMYTNIIYIFIVKIQ